MKWKLCYLSFYNKSPQNSADENNNFLLSLGGRGSVIQDGLVGQFCFGSLMSFQSKHQRGLQSSKGQLGSRRSDSRVAEKFILDMRSSNRSSGCINILTWPLASPEQVTTKEQGGIHNVLYNLASKSQSVISTIFCWSHTLAQSVWERDTHRYDCKKGKNHCGPSWRLRHGAYSFCK